MVHFSEAMYMYSYSYSYPYSFSQSFVSSFLAPFTFLPTRLWICDGGTLKNKLGDSPGFNV